MSKPEVAATKPVEVVLEPGDYFFCACGRSSNQPQCDGSHSVTDIRPVHFVVDEKESVLLCMCKQTANPPYCDGSHNDLDG